MTRLEYTAAGAFCGNISQSHELLSRCWRATSNRLSSILWSLITCLEYEPSKRGSERVRRELEMVVAGKILVCFSQSTREEYA